MPARRPHFYEAIAMLVGTIVGAGILGIPFVVARVGLGIGAAYIIGTGILFLLLNLMMGETVARTKKPMQLIGLSQRYLGRFGKRLAVLVLFLNVYGALLAYIIGEGEVLAALFGGTPFLWSLLFFIGGAILLATPIRSVARFELIFTIILFSIVIGIAGASVEHIALPNWGTIGLADFFLPFGVMLFAYGGSTAIPQMEELLGDRPRDFRWAIIIGSALPIVLYLVFAAMVVGVTGITTTEIASVGLGRAIGPWMTIAGNAFAFFAMSTSFVTLGFALKRSFEWDYRLRPWTAWAAAALPALIIFLLGARSFITVLNVSGSVLGGIMTILIVTTFWRAKRMGDVKSRAFNLHYGIPLGILLITLFMIGGLYSMLALQ